LNKRIFQRDVLPRLQAL